MATEKPSHKTSSTTKIKETKSMNGTKDQLLQEYYSCKREQAFLERSIADNKIQYYEQKIREICILQRLEGKEYE